MEEDNHDALKVMHIMLPLIRGLCSSIAVHIAPLLMVHTSYCYVIVWSIQNFSSMSFSFRTM